MNRKFGNDIFDGDEDFLQNELARAASKLSSQADDSATRALQWKTWLRRGEKTKFDLFEELSKAPLPMTYVPGPTQLRFHQSQARTKQMVGGWRVGKSKSMAAELLPYCLIDNAEIWIVASDYGLAQPEFKYLYEWLTWLGIVFDEKHGGQVSMPLNGKFVMRLPWGAEVLTKSAEDIKKLEAGNLNVAAIAEAGLMNSEALDKLRGRVAEKRGDILLSGSLEQAEWWYIEAFQEYLNGDENGSWQSFSAPSWENRIVFPLGEDDPELLHLKNTLPENIYLLKVCAQVAKSEEIVFPEFNEKDNVVPIEWAKTDPHGLPLDRPFPVMDEVGFKVIKWLLPDKTPIEIAVDPGYNGAYAVEFVQQFENNVFVIDEVYVRRIDIREVIKYCRDKIWWPYVRAGVIDVGGTQHQGMESHQEIWAQPQSGGIYLRSQYVPIEDGITRMRTYIKDPMTKRPRLWVSPRCKDLIKEFSQYSYRSTKENRSASEKPIDAYNHAIKAITYWLVDRFGFTAASDRRVTSERYIKNVKMPWHEGNDINPLGWNPLSTN